MEPVQSQREPLVEPLPEVTLVEKKPSKGNNVPQGPWGQDRSAYKAYLAAKKAIANNEKPNIRKHKEMIDIAMKDVKEEVRAVESRLTANNNQNTASVMQQAHGNTAFLASHQRALADELKQTVQEGLAQLQPSAQQPVLPCGSRDLPVVAPPHVALADAPGDATTPHRQQPALADVPHGDATSPHRQQPALADVPGDATSPHRQQPACADVPHGDATSPHRQQLP